MCSQALRYGVLSSGLLSCGENVNYYNKFWEMVLKSGVIRSGMELLPDAAAVMADTW